MKKSVGIALAALVLLLLGTSAVLFQKYHHANSRVADLQTEEENTRNRYGDAINEIASIQDSLNAIVLGDEGARMISSDLALERRLSQTGGDRAMARIAELKAGVERTKERIQQLDANLRKSGAKIDGLEKMLAKLRRNVKEKEQMIAQLTTQVEGLQTQVTTLDGEVQEKTRELGTVYYIAGTKTELKNSGVIVAKGGLLGLGKTIKPSGQVNEALFTAVDTDQETVIHIPAAKAQVVSAQPVTSYALEPVGTELELRILDPKEFRKIKHLIIVTAA